MTRLPGVSGKAVVRALERAGFVIHRQTSSHVFLRHRETGATVIAPVHDSRDLPRGTLQNILRRARLTADELATLPRG